MGVPKFYRWISERYPCLSEVVKEHQIPEFDNLYLDMNGIIHQCSHPNDDDVHFRISDDKIFTDIFHYLEVLFRIIKPRKVFFMAVDGVAPRAKMNQQRGRRFRSAKEAEDKIKKALEKGETLPTEARFDSNCITPGTEFMARLHEHLKYFVNMKISTDKSWQGVTIYFSGHETPGEGEHKIMEFIRSEKAKPDHDPNTRHCLYGLDADLIMLGLTSHETHFSLLREEVRFGGKKTQRVCAPEETTFHLLHLSLMREYIDYEFSELKAKITFKYDIERIIDDWILMGFLVGNDFIPHLPHLHINHDALPLLYGTYITILPELGGYINESGHLNLPRFEKYLVKLSDFDREHFSEVFVDLKWFESKVGNKYLNEAAGVAAEEARNYKEKKKSKGQENAICWAALDKNGEEVVTSKDNLEDETEDDDLFETEFRQYKRTYYMTKMGVDVVSDDFLADQAACYVQAIQWILHYYYHGVQSWSWYYPYHYAPFLSDIRNISTLKIHFELGKPFKPFEQLLAVLPAASKNLLPTCYQVPPNDPIKIHGIGWDHYGSNLALGAANIMPSSSHLFGSMPWGPPVPVPGKPFHHTSYSGTMPMAGGMPGGVHNQFIPLQVTKKRVANKKNFESKEAQCSATPLQTSQPGSSNVTKVIPQESSSASLKSSQITQPASSFQVEAASQGHNVSHHKSTPSSSSRRKSRKLAVNFGVSKPSE
ncbi:5'-3' exoribonuclease 1 isoform X4 [Canis lupus familiaris]|uniref:5'-3' exoribonuclease 1 isoform X4 n=1 Tax=Canis lupus familiaris TaxID=9615 RepID=UPI0018F4038C|nr:5'-3' exoribonuclease 1 isoform X4 [Canis lupus familiaris]